MKATHKKLIGKGGIDCLMKCCTKGYSRAGVKVALNRRVRRAAKIDLSKE